MSSRRRGLRLCLGLSWAVTALFSSEVLACGVSTADGASFCSLAEHEEQTRLRWHVGASGLYTSTTIDFTGGLHGDETRRSVVATLAYQPWRRITLQLAAGGTLGGQLTTPAGKYDFSDGPTAAAGAAWRVVDGTRPFVILTATLSFSAASTHPTPSGNAGAADNVSYEAFDLRVGALVGTTIFEVLSPYVVGRGFGGPVLWQYQGADVTGTDAHHFQIGAGANLLIARRVSLFAEGIPLGERSVAAGGAVAF
jgi:hypothetical protein